MLNECTLIVECDQGFKNIVIGTGWIECIFTIWGEKEIWSEWIFHYTPRFYFCHSLKEGEREREGGAWGRDIYWWSKQLGGSPLANNSGCGDRSPGNGVAWLSCGAGDCGCNEGRRQPSEVLCFDQTRTASRGGFFPFIHLLCVCVCVWVTRLFNSPWHPVVLHALNPWSACQLSEQR